LREAFGGKQVPPMSKKPAAMRTTSRFAKGVMMKSKMRVGLLACAVGREHRHCADLQRCFSAE
jgi:hypothetical protein